MVTSNEGDNVPPSIAAFDDLITSSLNSFVSMSAKLNNDLNTIVN